MQLISRPAKVVSISFGRSFTAVPSTRSLEPRDGWGKILTPPPSPDQPIQNAARQTPGDAA